MVTIHANGSTCTLNRAAGYGFTVISPAEGGGMTIFFRRRPGVQKIILDLFFCKCESAPLDILLPNLLLRARPVRYIIPQGKIKR
jgi:hypothetical protein